MNIWTGDGFKDVPADRIGPRVRYREAIDEILREPYDFTKVKHCIESKVFGIGVEAYTVGSAEFALSYAAMNMDKCIPLMDNGHYHPTEVVSDKIPALLAFFPEIALHVTRPIRWDSDHVVLFDDETKEIAREIVRCGGLDGKVNIALDYFDASINRISAWVTGYRNLQKALLFALLQPNAELKALQDAGSFTKLMVMQEELKTLPFGEIWDEYCRSCGKPADGEWYPQIEEYEKIAGDYGFEIKTQGVTDASEIASGIASLLASGIDCLCNLTDNNVVNNFSVVTAATDPAGVPCYGSEEEQVAQYGCVASETLDYIALGKTTGKMAADVLDGADIMTMPVSIVSDSEPVYSNANLAKFDMAVPADYAGARVVGE
jgi:hypothetical protein